MPTDYLISQWEILNKWESRPPSLGKRLILKTLPGIPFARLIKWVLPDQWIEDAIIAAEEGSKLLVFQNAFSIESGYPNLAKRQNAPLESCDMYAQKVGKLAISYAFSGGGLIAGNIPFDLSFLLSLSFHTIHETCICYGFGHRIAGDRRFSLAILLLAAANSPEQKNSALTILRQLHKADEAKLPKHETILELLSQQLMEYFFKGKPLRAIPVLNRAVAASLNAYFIGEVGECAMRACQRRWFQINGDPDFSGI
jgi:hypothetical protein